MLATPYVSTAAFRAHPTYLDLDSLRPDQADPALQNAALTDLLIQASEWADNEANQPFGAHVTTQTNRVFTDRAGMVRIHAEHGPVISVLSLAYGSSLTALTTLTTPQAWIENNTNMVIGLGNISGPWSGALQFGVASAGIEIFARTTLVAGRVATVLAAASTAGAMSLSVADVTGIQPGGRYRIWEPGSEETVTVAASWTPPDVSAGPMPASVPLVAATGSAHGKGHDISALPAEVRGAVVAYTTALLMRPDTAAEDEFPDTTMPSTTRGKDSRPKGMGLVAEARRILASYAAVR